MKAIVCLWLCSFALQAEEPATPALTLTKTIPLPGVKGRFDHFAIDPEGHRLFVAALGNDTLEVIDIAAGKHLRSIGGLHKPTGVLFLSVQNRIAVANGDDGTLKLFDGTSYALLETVTGLDDADNLRYDASAKTIHLGYGAGALALIDASSLKRAATIKLPAHPESFQLETDGDRVFVNLPDATQISVVDRRSQTVTATWKLDRFHSNFPMALDEGNRRVFIGCRLPARLLVLDTTTGRPAANLELAGDIDDLFYDSKRRRLYASCGEGFVDVIQQAGPDQYRRVERRATRSGARTCFFASSTDELFVAVPKRGTEAAELRIYRAVP